MKISIAMSNADSRVVTPCSAADLELVGLRDNGEARRKPNSGKAVRQEQIVIRVFIHCANTCPSTAPNNLMTPPNWNIARLD